MRKASPSLTDAAALSNTSLSPGSPGAAEDDAPALQPVDERSVDAMIPSETVAYELVVRALIPGWRRIIGVTPWWSALKTLRPGGRLNPRTLYRRQAAALGLVVADALDLTGDRPTGPREQVRATLVQWCGALDPTGRPVTGRARSSPLWPAITQQVIRLLDVAPEYQGPSLLADLERHLQWLTKRRPRSPWLEAALIETLATGAVLVRDTDVLHTARGRLHHLLHRQNGEGWFPESGGADFGRLSLTVGALAPLWREHGWDELREPLERAVRFLAPFVEAGAAAAACINACHTTFVAPFGLERLAVRIPEAAHVACVLRAYYEGEASHAVAAWNDERTAVLGATIALSAYAAPRGEVELRGPEQTPGADTVFPEAGLRIIERPEYRAVIATKRGGRLYVRWKNGRALEDAGITVVFPHTTRTGSRSRMSDQIRSDESGASWRGILTKVGRRRPGWMARTWRPIVRFILRRGRRSVASRFHADGVRDRRRLLHDWFTREIRFDDDHVRIRDQVHCRLPCEAVVLGDASGANEMRMGHDEAAAQPQTPLVIEGGRAVTITRVYRHGKLDDVTVERHAEIF